MIDDALIVRIMYTLMKKTLLSIIAMAITLLSAPLSGQSCLSDTISSDIIFLVDNSQSIDNAEYLNFEQLILTTIQKAQAKCQHAQIGVVHYGGAYGESTFIEYPLQKNNTINQVNRQFCTQRIGGQCVGGGGDNLNSAIGDILAYLQNGQLDYDARNKMNLVILTDAFGTEDTCTFTNCSTIRPYTNINQLKTQYDAKVTVAGMSSQAAATFLGVYASPGGSFTATDLFTPDCTTAVDGCGLPRKYIPLEFNSPVAPSSDSIVACIDCQINIVTPLSFSLDANSTSICNDRGESSTLTISITSGLAPYSINWGDGNTSMSRTVSPTTTTTYGVTIRDANNCVATRQVTINSGACGPDCSPDTISNDIIFVIDNSQSIDDSEFIGFEDILLASINSTRASCPQSNIAVVHYGGRYGKFTTIEYGFQNSQNIQAINRQYCSSRNEFNQCIGGGGDDLNHAIGNVIQYFEGGQLTRNTNNKLSMVIFTDAFGFETCDSTTTNNSNCSAALPYTNIDRLKIQFDAKVTVVGMSSQAEATVLATYASPGGTFDNVTLFNQCAGTADGCILPRKYISAQFNSNPSSIAAEVIECIACQTTVAPVLVAEAGDDQTICFNLGQSSILTASAIAGSGSSIYTYVWTDAAGISRGTTRSITVNPAQTTKYFVQITDSNSGCAAIDSVTVISRICSTCLANAGTPLPHRDICLVNGSIGLQSTRNNGVVIPPGYEEVFILTDQNLTIVDYSIGSRNFVVRSPGIYRIHTLIAETTRGRPEFIDIIALIVRNVSNLFVIVNCIEDHGICADFDFPGRVFQVFGPNDMMCMRFENSIALCSDGLDNDGDGLIDCRDPDCQGKENCLENTLIACNDQYDNDKDGLIDCFDPDCFGFELCSERTEKCNDGIDNDGDGLIDCADSSCRDSGLCKEESPFTCADGLDNDGDGLIDCQEASCQRFIVCAESTLAACMDGKDNDYDGLIDCADANCKQFVQICQTKEDTQSLCRDGFDNDGDGLVDCLDPDCRSTAPCGGVSGFATVPQVEIRVFLQGAILEDGSMATSLNDQGYLPGQKPKTFFGASTPPGQPYTQSPWFYEGQEGLSLKKKTKNSQEYEYPSTVVDWVLVSLRKGIQKYDEVWKTAALLHQDGTIEVLKSLDISLEEEDGYYIVIEHRNHLPVMSAKKVSLNKEGKMSYDFSTTDSFRSFLGIGQKQLNGRWVMAAGNGEMVTELSSDIDINVRDLTSWLQNNGSNSSYYIEDYDMNGDVNIRDRILWELNNGIFSSLRTK